MTLCRLNLLASHAFLRRDREFLRLLSILGRRVNVLIDSGAYSDYHAALAARKAGVAYSGLTLADYTKACMFYRTFAWQYVAFDVIGDPARTRANLRAMVRAGLSPMAVYQEGETLDNVPELIDHNAHLALGGMTGKVIGNSRHYTRHRVLAVYEASKRKALLHSLGFVKLPDAFLLPLHSADSTTHINGQKWGELRMFDPVRGFDNLYLAASLPADRWKGTTGRRALRLLCDSGVTREQMNDPAYWRGGESITAFLTELAWLRFMDHAQRCGFGMFLVITRSTDMHLLLALLESLDGNHFDYPLAKHGRGAWARLWARSKDAYVERSIDTIERTTDTRRTIA